MTGSFRRREMLKALGLVGAAPAWAQQVEPASDEELAARWFQFIGETSARPEFVWTNCEDIIYHDESYPPALQTQPEFYALMRQPWVFNRAMEWHREDLDGCILCYSTGGALALTGEKQASRWFTEPANGLEDKGRNTRFVKHSKRRRDCAVLPGFQFHLRQHPRLVLNVSQSNADWQFVVSIKGRSGPPLLSSGWRRGASTFEADLALALRRRGYDLNFPELHFAIGTWSENPSAECSITFTLEMPTQAALVTALPVIRKAGTPVPIVAVALDNQGRRIGTGRVTLFAVVGGTRFPMRETNGIWKAVFREMKPGDDLIPVVAREEIYSTVNAVVRVTDGRFFSYDSAKRLVARDSKPVGPVSGSFQGSFFFKDAGRTTEQMILGQRDWDSWQRKLPPGEHMHYWESLTPRELDQRFLYLSRCGWDLLHVCQHWGIWEKLDAGGRIAPHAAEQLSLYMRTGARYGLSVIQSLTHYHYARDPVKGRSGQTIPFSRYLDEGFQNEDWFKPGGRFNELFHQYLADFTSLFKDETALFAMTASGEGDAYIGRERAQDIHDFVRSRDPNHLFLGEPVHRLTKLPDEQVQGWKTDLNGARTYWIGQEIDPEDDLGVEFKFYNMGQLFLAEGSFAAMPRYVEYRQRVLDNAPQVRESWTGTQRYRTRLRDTLYLGLIHHLPIMNTWDEQVAEDEHFVLRRVREIINWEQAWMQPPVVIRVGPDNLAGAGRANLARYQKALSQIPVASRFITAGAAQPESALAVFDARQPFEEPNLPDALRASMPLTLSPGFAAEYCWSEDRATLVAYVYGVVNHEEMRTPHDLSGARHRIPKPASLRIGVRNLPYRSLRCRIFDLKERALFKDVFINATEEWRFGMTDADYLLLITPAG